LSPSLGDEVYSNTKAKTKRSGVYALLPKKVAEFENETANRRTIYQYIREQKTTSCLAAKTGGTRKGKRKGRCGGKQPTSYMYTKCTQAFFLADRLF
jgi:hypothetical protein